MTPPTLSTHQLGLTFATNPFLEPVKTFGKKPDEFVVLRCDVELPAPAQVELRVDVRGPDGAQAAAFKSLEIMQYYWSTWPGQEDEKNARASMLFRSYAPDLSFAGRAGRKSYYLVCMGKNPLPRPFTVEARVMIDGVDADSLEATVSEMYDKKTK